MSYQIEDHGSRANCDDPVCISDKCIITHK